MYTQCSAHYKYISQIYKLALNADKFNGGIVLEVAIFPQTLWPI